MFLTKCDLVGTIFCWGLNEVDLKGQTHTPCTFLITDETAPQPLTDCEAVQDLAGDIIVKCEKGYDGGLAQVNLTTHTFCEISTYFRRYVNPSILIL